MKNRSKFVSSIIVSSIIVGSIVLLGAILASVPRGLGAATAQTQQLAFPEAEGYGKYATGGRGGAVYEVTTLNPTGAGSLGAAIGASGPRTVVFRVGGTITGNFNIQNGNITIAGQTAPGDGICIKGTLNISADNVIIRYIRVRNDISVNPESDSVAAKGRQNIILDHVSASWSGDEVMSLYLNHNVTIQWCMITEACAKFINGQNTGHQFGGLWGNNLGTFHHNLIAHNASRNPRWASGVRDNDYRNNVIYNWDYESCYGGEKQSPDGSTFWNYTTINMIANYYKAGPATDSGVRNRIANPSARSSTDKGSWYISGNYVDGFPTVTADNWLGVVGSNYIRLNSPWPAMPINQQSPQDAYDAVLAHVGCSKPRRDSVDTRIINEVRNGTATYGNSGIINRPSDVGGWPTLASGTPPADADHDGMPDAWETARGLNPNNAADRNGDLDGDGYTNLEEYLNELGAFGGPPSNAPPSVSITSPADGATFTAPANITIDANASDSDGTVTSVQFYQGSTLLGTDTTAPYSFTWNNVSAGSYSLTARATDDDGATTTSSAVNVTVSSGGGPLPSPWQTSDIGAVAAAGSASHSNGVFTVEGSGADIWGTADEFRFVYQTVSGDCDIRARVTSVENTNVWAKAGVMIRETLNANSVHASSVVTPGSGVSFQRRPSTGGTSSHTTLSGITAPRWVRVARSGATFTAYHSADGTNWTTIGSQSITMSASVYIGLAVTSHADGALCTGTFDNVTVTAGPPLNSPPIVSITSPGNGATFTAPATITIDANASDSDGTISSVQFYQGSTLLGTDTAAPYSFTWSNVPAGSYSLTARATDNDGATTTSSAVNVMVNSSGSDNIVWTPVQNILGDFDVSAEGTLVRAVNLTRSGGAYDTNVTVNGVTFVRAPYTGTTTTLANGDTLVTSDSTAVGAYEGFGGSTAPFSSLSANYQTLLRSGHYNDGDLANPATTARITLTLNNLTVGAQYQLQVWVNDFRVVNLGQNNPGLVTTVADSASSAVLEHNVNNALGGIGQYVIGTFIASAPTKVITLTGGNTGTDTSVPNCAAIWNAYQLRRLQ